MKHAVAITGATGFIGRYLVSSLRHQGARVVPLSRRDLYSRVLVNSSKVGAAEERPLCGIETVIHCAALAQTPQSGSSVHSEQIRELYSTNCNLVEQVAEACLRDGVRRLVFLSTAKVYGESSIPGRPFKESDPLAPEDPYAESKCRAEQILERFETRGLQVIRLRLPLVYGAESKGNFLRLQSLSRSRFPLPLASIQNTRSLLSLSNLALVISALLRSDHWSYSQLNVADTHPVSTPDLLTIMAQAQGHKPRLVPCPPICLRLIGRMLRRSGDVERLVGDLVLSTDRLEASFDCAEIQSTKDSLFSLLGKYDGILQ